MTNTHNNHNVNLVYVSKKLLKHLYLSGVSGLSPYLDSRITYCLQEIFDLRIAWILQFCSCFTIPQQPMMCESSQQ